MRLTRALVLAIFLASGAAGLVYEVVWTRQLSLVFGVTTYAAATVLATFMGGLALGSYVFGRRVDRGGNPLLAYAALEGGVGLYALLVPHLLGALVVPYVWLRQLELPYAVLALLRALLAAGVLVVPTALMGGTFPILVRLFAFARGELGRVAAVLYFVNTLGALAGCLAAGFVLISRLGLERTTWVAAGTSLAVAAIAAFLGTRNAASFEAKPTDERPATRELSPRMARLVLVAIGISGFTSLAYEVVWTRALPRYVYNSTYAFTTMLATFLAGIALGSASHAAWLRGRRRPVLWFAALELGVGVGFLLSSYLFADLRAISDAILGRNVVESFGQSVLLIFLRAALILLLPAVFLGATLPLATELCARGLATAGGTVGRVYAVNTLGAILGSLAAAFVLIPGLGMQGTLLFLIAVNFLLAWMLAVSDTRTPPRRLAVGASLGAAALGALLLVPSDLFRRTFAPPGTELVFYREGVTDTVGVIEQNGQRIIEYEDQRGTAGTATFPFNYFFGHLPMLLHPGEPRLVLHICFGVGNSLSAVAAHESVERVDSVELSPHVLEAGRYFWSNSDVLSHPKVRTIIDDGRNFVLASRETYDVILLEPPEIFTAGVINLYTREFYRDAAARLAPDGVMMQWVPIGEAPLEEERMLFRAFSDVFPHATAWEQLMGGPILLIGTHQPLRIDYARLRSRMAEPHIRRDLELAGIQGPDDLLSYFIFDEQAFRSFAAEAPPVTDDRTVLDFTMPYFLGSGFGLGSFSLYARADGEGAPGPRRKRAQMYFAQRRSVIPYLILDGETSQEVEARIRATRIGHPPALPVPESSWRRW
ncbi:MAG TPA: fused MFS/spermidine synthase [Myxococcota bacterium]|nr:fused MFS/spermidine synthase [Myxococcota bacterium]